MLNLLFRILKYYFMKKFILISVLAVVASAASAQEYVAGLNFDMLVDLTADSIEFDSGDYSDGWALNLNINGSDDNYSYSGYEAIGWAGLGETYTDGTNTLYSGQANVIPATVQVTSGFTASTSLFGNTAAAAQGFDDTAGITFGSGNADVDIDLGVFTITVGTNLIDAYINFDVAALDSQDQEAGTIVVSSSTESDTVSVTSSATNVTVSLGDLSVGDIITFDLSGLANGAVFDNFMVAGTVVPEPSSFAVIAGAIALGFTATRRRRRA
jgi:hypothetical protein